MQRKTTSRCKARSAEWACAALLALVLAGCGDAPGAVQKVNAAQPKTGAAAKTAPSNGASSAGAASAAKPPQILSVFNTNDTHDPFHPKLKPKIATASAQQNAQPEPNQIVSAIEAGFSGTVGAGEERVALVYGLLLEKQRETTLSLNVGGTLRHVKVKPLRILRNAVELQVEGVPQPVTITKRTR
jgi:hypothetical protein